MLLCACVRFLLRMCDVMVSRLCLVSLSFLCFFGFVMLVFFLGDSLDGLFRRRSRSSVLRVGGGPLAHWHYHWKSVAFLNRNCLGRTSRIWISSTCGVWCGIHRRNQYYYNANFRPPDAQAFFNIIRLPCFLIMPKINLKGQ